jgi:purine-nucleoside phosphorylase
MNIMNSSMLDSRRIQEAYAHVQQHVQQTPRVALILGTGLGQFADRIENPVAISYADIPHFPHSSAPDHKGQLVSGSIKGVPLIAMQGRFHLYEGHPINDAVLPVHVMRKLGADILIISNASGGVNTNLSGGDILVINNHINLTFHVNPQLAALTQTRNDIKSPIYDPQLIEDAMETGRREGFYLQQGCYVALTGPNYETRSEYRMVRKIGGDVVGMSTVPEVLVAHTLGMRVLALSAVTNVAKPDALVETTAEGVIDIAQLAEPKLNAIVMTIVDNINRE